MTRYDVMRFAPLPLLVAAVVALHRAGDLLPATSAADPAAAAMGGMRYAGLAIGWYLVVAASPECARRLARWLAGAAVAMATIAPGVPAGAQEEEPPVLRHLPEETERSGLRAASTGERGAVDAEPDDPAVATATSTSTTSTTTTTTTAPPTTTTTKAAVPPAPASAPVRTHEGRASAETRPQPEPRERPETRPDHPDTGSWTVRPGDHLWSIAERTLATEWQRSPTAAEVVPYWQQVIERNRDRLADPANPDLIFTSQVMALPAPPPPPTQTAGDP